MYADLHRLHHRFGHPHVEVLVNLLKRANIDQIDSETHRMLVRIEQSCTLCQECAQHPHRFKLNLRDNLYFNHTI